MRKLCTAFCAFSFFFLSLALARAADLTPDASFDFSGQVDTKRSFTHVLPEGLYFHLYPTETGWFISVNSSEDKQETTPEFDLARITPPLHGPNPTQIDLDSILPGKEMDTIYGNKRNFEFALSGADLKIIFDSYECANVPLQDRTVAGKRCERVSFPSRRGFGTLIITKVHSEKLREPVGDTVSHVSAGISFTVSGSIRKTDQSQK